MDHGSLEDKTLFIDLESGRVTSEEGSIQDLLTGDRQVPNIVSGSVIGLLGSSISVGSESSINPYVGPIIGGENDEASRTLVEKYAKKKRHKKMNCKKAAKPPRPPRGPLLDAADMRLVKEISTHAMTKRLRLERIKAMRKMREGKSSSLPSKSSILALIITILFFVVICFQGFCSKGINSVNFHGSPEPATNSLISVQFFNNPSSIEGSGPGSSSSAVEQTFGTNFRFPE